MLLSTYQFDTDKGQPLMKTYSIKANRKPADVIANNDETLETGLTIEEAKVASLEYQRQRGHIAVWIEEEAKAAPRIVRSVESNRAGIKFSVVRIDGWAV
jgi:hypothetical protein